MSGVDGREEGEDSSCELVRVAGSSLTGVERLDSICDGRSGGKVSSEEWQLADGANNGC